ncbi:hypothetical protein HDU90_008795 [Geranomyces variabilis]|nr:hypothetical protein HDU90_008795 [Geranomyces variabilis]
MVQIVLPTTIATADNGGDGLVLLELQGSLSTDSTEGLAGLHLGHFSICPTTGTPTLSIGHHKLEGRRVELRKPFAVVRKRQRDAASTRPQPPLSSSSSSQPSSSTPPPPPPPSSPQPQSHPENNPTQSNTHPPPVRLELSLSLSQGADMTPMMQMDDDSPPPPQEDQEEPHPNTPSPPPPDGNMTTAAAAGDNDDPPQHLYDVVAVLRFKYLFKSRPEHVLADEHKGLIALPRR